MRKNILRLVSCITILSFLLSVFGINSFADDDTDTCLSTYAAKYFTKLTHNFGNNQEGSCGYVAAGMLLSYYDSFLSDEFIPENYDENGECSIASKNVTTSPGIGYEADWETVPGHTTYNDFIDSNASTNLHCRLLQIGRDNLHLQDLTFEEWIESLFGQTKEADWGITTTNLALVINTYFSTVTSSTIRDNVVVNVASYKDDLHINNDNPNELIREEMIEKIKAGIPVIYFGYSESTKGGHFLIGYDYDEDNDEIYFHTGWDDDTLITDKDTTHFIYTANTAFIWLDVNENNLTHTHTNNYVDSQSSASFCACQIYSEHPEHEHVGHTIGYTSTYHTFRCDWCGDISQSHSYSYTPYNNTMHLSQCRCGYSKREPHIISTGFLDMQMCIKCLHRVDSGFEQMGLTSGVVYITSNGSYIRPDGIIVLSEIDLPRYLSGELDLDNVYPTGGLTH